MSVRCFPLHNSSTIYYKHTHTCPPKLLHPTHIPQLTIVSQHKSNQLCLNVETSRRSANYQSSIWSDDSVQSLNSSFKAKEYVEEIENLKRVVEVMLDTSKPLLDQLELIDDLQRLDISNHFSDRIQKLLDNLCSIYVACQRDGISTLYATALQFRLLRQHGCHVPQEVFQGFMEDDGNYKACLADDVKGLLSLYEASFLSMEGETILDSAKSFAIRHLKQKLEANTVDTSVADEIRHALELPLHWRIQKLEARWFVNVYRTRPDANATLLRLAILNYNTVQAQYQDEVKSLSRWYRETGLSAKLGFARHRLVESFYWALGIIPEPHLAHARMSLCKVAVWIIILDDIFDVYGTLDELNVLTEKIQRWDINELDSLPDYMRITFLAFFNSINEMGYHIMRDKGHYTIPDLRKSWAELITAFNLEAKWYRTGYIPRLNEYLDLAWTSVSGPVNLLHAYLHIADPINSLELERLEEHPGVIRWPSMVFRLTNDLATTTDEMKRGDAPSSVQCYMREKGCSEEEARHYIEQLKDTMWKRMNKEVVMEKGMGLNKGFLTSAMNLGRIAQCLYQFGDGMGTPSRDTKRNMNWLIVEPLPMQRAAKTY